jgi:pimeloyl-ACP methyl ester carboxylesterase
MTQAATMTSGYVNVNGVNIAFCVQGEGPPLVLIMGYRLNSIAWPATFVDVLKRSFTVITLDNRGTGRSDKPLTGYALANMARDVAALLDEIDIESTYVLGYSMGGAIAQEFVRQFPDRVTGLILCATMCGSPRATYAEPPVVRVVRDLDGLSTEQIARQIWQVTYAPLIWNRTLDQPRIRFDARSRYLRRCMPRTCNSRRSPNSTARTVFPRSNVPLWC